VAKRFQNLQIKYKKKKTKEKYFLTLYYFLFSNIADISFFYGNVSRATMQPRHKDKVERVFLKISFFKTIHPPHPRYVKKTIPPPSLGLGCIGCTNWLGSLLFFF
jgi:hypothetical protein